jgi:hypothetical protein
MLDLELLWLLASWILATVSSHPFLRVALLFICIDAVLRSK